MVDELFCAVDCDNMVLSICEVDGYLLSAYISCLSSKESIESFAFIVSIV